MSGRVAPAVALAHVAPEFFDTLTDAERLVLPFMHDLWLRPEQRVRRDGDWRYHGFIAGRGWGKSYTIATEINRRVEEGTAKHVALMAPTEPRVEEVQIKFLLDTAPPWFRPEPYKGGLVWPNGVCAVVFTPEAPGRSRSENIELTWLCEIVDWQANTRKDAFENITTATRIGRAQVIWDTTSKGKNEVIRHLESLNASDPYVYPITRGTTFDNPLLSRKYLASVCRQYTGRRYEEEILGRTFNESAGAVFRQEWIDAHRVSAVLPPDAIDLRLVAVDPALSNREDADETGIVVGSRDREREDVYVEQDLSGRYAPEEWGDIVVRQCADNGAAGAIVERNHLGDHPVYVLRSRAANRGLTVHVLAKGKPFPRRVPGRIYVREVVAARDKISRAGGPAAETEAGRVHLVGELPELELELTTYEPGVSKSPNRYDSCVYLVTELRGLAEAPPPTNPIADVHDARKAHAQLRERLSRIGRRPVGL